MLTFMIPLLFLKAAPVRAQSTATWRGLDVYRSEALSPVKARALFGARLARIVSLRNQRRPDSTNKAEILRREIEREAEKIPGVASAQLVISEYFTSVDHALYATFDIVDENDRGRLAFTPAPKKTLTDPGGLLADWTNYYELGSVLSRRGQMPVERPDCPGFYCLWGGATPELDALQKKFIVGAEAKERELITALRHEANAAKRAAALFILSYGRRGDKVIELCLAALKDPAPPVRGAGLQILADIINLRKDLRVDADLILPRLDDPSSSVRGKTLGLLVPLVDIPLQRKKILAAAQRLIGILKLAEPGSHDLAFTVLRQLSLKTFDQRDYENWQKWARESAAELKQ